MLDAQLGSKARTQITRFLLAQAMIEETRVLINRALVEWIEMGE